MILFILEAFCLILIFPQRKCPGVVSLGQGLSGFMALTSCAMLFLRRLSSGFWSQEGNSSGDGLCVLVWCSWGMLHSNQAHSQACAFIYVSWSFLSVKIYFHMYKCFAPLYSKYTACMPSVHRDQKSPSFPRTGVTDSCEHCVGAGIPGPCARAASLINPAPFILSFLVISFLIFQRLFLCV